MLRRALPTLVLLLVSVGAFAETPKQRHFTFHYSFTVKNVPAGQPVRVWIPMAHSGEFQTVRVISQSGDLPLRKTQEHEFSNWVLYAESPKAIKSEYHFSVDYDVIRREQQVLAEGRPVSTRAAHRQAVRVGSRR